MKSISTYDLAKKNYERGLWTFSMLKALVKKGFNDTKAIGKLAPEEFKDITGFDYPTVMDNAKTEEGKDVKNTVKSTSKDFTGINGEFKIKSPISTCDLTKKNYERGLWTFSMLKALAKKGSGDTKAIGKLTQEEFKDITGFDYR